MSKKTNEGYFTSTGGRYPVYFKVCRDTDIEPKAVLQFAHGMVEHIGCYNEMVDALIQMGYIVAANDHVGHGHSVNETEELGYFADKDGDEVWLQDMRHFCEHLHKSFPTLPHFLLGHSMGSFLARLYITRYPEDFNGVILCGTANYPNFLSHCTNLVRFSSHIIPLKRKAPGIYRMGVRMMNRPFRKEKGTGTQYLSRRLDNRMNHLEDPLCGYPYTWAGYRDLLSLVTKISGPKWASQVPAHLPILLISGQNDPIGGNGRAIYQTVELLKKVGNHPEAILYPDDRHELLQEEDREEVYGDIDEWIQKIINKLPEKDSVSP